MARWLARLGLGWSTLLRWWPRLWLRRLFCPAIGPDAVGTPLAPGKSLLLSAIVQSWTSKAPAQSRRGFCPSSVRWNRQLHSCNFTGNSLILSQTGNNFDPNDLVQHHVCNGHKAVLTMNSRITDNGEQIDRKTTRSICDAVGERLQQSLRPEPSRLSSHLQHLMDELRKRDSENRRRPPN